MLMLFLRNLETIFCLLYLNFTGNYAFLEEKYFSSCRIFPSLLHKDVMRLHVYTWLDFSQTFCKVICDMWDMSECKIEKCEPTGRVAF